MVDTRRPALVTQGFLARLAQELGPLGFEARKKALVRRVGPAWHRIELSSSHHNVPGDVTGWVSLVVTDRRVAEMAPGWRAGGPLGGPAFADDPPTNVADPRQAEELVQRVRRRLSFFDLMQDPASTLQAVCLRYVPGLVDPRVVLPYLLAHLGAGAVESYARALLRGRPELWPAFEGAHRRTPRAGANADHGTELARELARLGLAFADAPPAGTVECSDEAAASLRCFFGRQLRAWGEDGAARRLHRVADARVRAVHEEQAKLPGPAVDDPERARRLLREVTGETRPPRRRAPEPRLFQYHVLHGPFTPLRAVES